VTRHGRQARSAPRIDLSLRLARPTGLRWQVHALGALVWAAYAGLTALSFVQAAALWRQRPAPRARAVFEAFATHIEPFSPSVAGWFLDKPLFASASSVVCAVWIGLALVSAAVLVLTLVLLNRPQSAVSALPGLVLRWAYAHAAVCALAWPVFTQDLWLSAVWGRMIAAGANPFHTRFTAETLVGLPLDHFPMPMSYGPLWGLLSGGVMLIAGESTLLATVLFKAVIAGLWLASLKLVFRLTEELPHTERSVALLLFGWLPAGVSQSLAEGHNDIAMVALVLVWLWLLQRGRAQAAVALVASVLCKYVTAPLLLIDAIDALRRQKIGWRRYLLRLVLPAMFGLAVMAVFYRSTAFFDGVRLIGTWYFLQPRDAVYAMETVLGLPLQPLALTVTVLFPAYALYALWRAWTEPRWEHLLHAGLAIMSAVLFTAVSHLWAWYVIWTLALAALLPAGWLSRFNIGVAVVAPFTLGSWWLEPFEDYREGVALAMYALAILWAIVTRPAPPAAAPEVAERA
jgi:alpha-1,6-mannosyltransferase